MRKRVIPWLLIILVLLNTMGYYFIIGGFELKNDAEASRALDNDYYDSSQTVTIRIPIALPYQYDNTNFMRVEGKFIHKGESYRLIKQKYANDTVTVICIKDETDSKIQSALAHVAGTYVDTKADAHSTSKAQTIFMKEYVGAVPAVVSGTNGWAMDLESESPIQLFEDVCVPHHPRPPES